MSVARALNYIGPDAAKPAKATRRAPTKRRKLSPVQQIAIGSGSVAGLVLGLSVVDCTQSLASLTGIHPALAGLLAIGIDAGMVASELAELIAHASKHAKSVKPWARAYMALAVAMSMVLNGVAFGRTSYIGAGIGVIIPIMVLILGRIAGKLWIAGK